MKRGYTIYACPVNNCGRFSNSEGRCPKHKEKLIRTLVQVTGMEIQPGEEGFFTRLDREREERHRELAG